MLSFEANNSHFYKVLCLKGNEALHLCMNEQCERAAFVCSNKGCKCRSQHKSCYYAVASSVIEKVKSKVINTSDLQNKIKNYMKIMDEKMNLFYESFIRHLQDKSTYFGLMSNERDFLSSLDQLSINKITGRNIASICSNLKPNKQYFGVFDRLRNQVDSHFQSFFFYLKQFQQIMYCAVEGMSQSLSEKYLLSKCTKSPSSKNVFSAQTIPTVTQSYESILANQKSQTIVKINSKMFEGSKIIKSSQEQQNLLSFLNKRKIKSTTLLYRASQNGFSTKRFHVECDQVANTLIVCKTENGRVIGGYTPLMWEIVKGQMSQERDPSMNTFIFSLTENLRFTPIKIRQKSYALDKISSGVSIIKHTSEIGPCFGRFQFVIKEDAHTQGQNAWIRYEKSNPSFNYIQAFDEPRQYFKAMLGSYQPYFRTRDWQVWKIKFRNEGTNIKF